MIPSTWRLLEVWNECDVSNRVMCATLLCWVTTPHLQPFKVLQAGPHVRPCEWVSVVGSGYGRRQNTIGYAGKHISRVVWSTTFPLLLVDLPLWREFNRDLWGTCRLHRAVRVFFGNKTKGAVKRVTSSCHEHTCINISALFLRPWVTCARWRLHHVRNGLNALVRKTHYHLFVYSTP